MIQVFSHFVKYFPLVSQPSCFTCLLGVCLGVFQDVFLLATELVRFQWGLWWVQMVGIDNSISSWVFGNNKILYISSFTKNTKLATFLHLINWIPFMKNVRWKSKLRFLYPFLFCNSYLYWMWNLSIIHNVPKQAQINTKTYNESQVQINMI